jgi:hypothetical protein
VGDMGESNTLSGNVEFVPCSRRRANRDIIVNSVS